MQFRSLSYNIGQHAYSAFGIEEPFSLRHRDILNRQRQTKELLRWKSVSVAIKSIAPFMEFGGALFNVIATAFMPSDLSVIEGRFDKVDRKLEGISRQMNKAKNDIMANTDYAIWNAMVTEWINAIDICMNFNIICMNDPWV